MPTGWADECLYCDDVEELPQVDQFTFGKISRYGKLTCVKISLLRQLLSHALHQEAIKVYGVLLLVHSKHVLVEVIRIDKGPRSEPELCS